MFPGNKELPLIFLTLNFKISFWSNIAFGYQQICDIFSFTESVQDYFAILKLVLSSKCEYVNPTTLNPPIFRKKFRFTVNANDLKICMTYGDVVHKALVSKRTTLNIFKKNTQKTKKHVGLDIRVEV